MCIMFPWLCEWLSDDRRWAKFKWHRPTHGLWLLGSSAFRLFVAQYFMKTAAGRICRAFLPLWRCGATLRRYLGNPVPDSGRAAAAQPQIGIVAIGLREPDARRQMAQRRRQP